jgi:exodeoxyribonuclease III
VRKIVAFTTPSALEPAAASTAVRFSSTRSVWARTSPATSSPVRGSSGICPEQKTSPPATMACEYGPIAAGAASVAMTLLSIPPCYKPPVRLATWNVNSVRAREQRLLAFLARHRPDVLCLQELKAEESEFPLLAVRGLGYDAAIFGQRTYNGVAILARAPLEGVECGLSDGDADAQCRLIHAKVADVHVLSAYFPNGQDVGSDKYAYKLAFMKRLRAYLDRRFDKERDEVVLMGDFNVAPYSDDVSKPAEFEGGVLANDEVRAALAEIAAFGLVDLFRPFHPRGHVYTWWDYRARGFERNDGLRIDHAYGTAKVAARCIGAVVDREERTGTAPSDHAPPMIELE